MITVRVQMREIGSVTARTGFAQVLRAELTKFVTLRTNLWALIAAAVVSIGVGAVFTAAHLEFWSGLSAEERAKIDAVQESFIGLAVFGLLGFAVIGALAMTSEYSSGTISSTLAAVPKRRHVLLAKTLVVGLVTLVFATVTAFAAFFPAQPILGQESLDVSISDSRVLFAVIGGGIYSTGAALIGLALGGILRRTAATLVAVTLVFSLATIVAQVQPESWSTYTKYLPHSAGLAVIASIDSSTLLSPLAGLIVLTGWAAAGLIAAAILFERRDSDA
jgi:ABC-2 type transport system permease protein